jgi:hypothetical protein
LPWVPFLEFFVIVHLVKQHGGWRGDGSTALHAVFGGLHGGVDEHDGEDDGDCSYEAEDDFFDQGGGWFGVGGLLACEDDGRAAG